MSEKFNFDKVVAEIDKLTVIAGTQDGFDNFIMKDYLTHYTVKFNSDEMREYFGIPAGGHLGLLIEAFDRTKSLVEQTGIQMDIHINTETKTISVNLN